MGSSHDNENNGDNCMTSLSSKLRKIVSGKTMPYVGDMYSNLAYAILEDVEIVLHKGLYHLQDMGFNKREIGKIKCLVKKRL